MTDKKSPKNLDRPQTPEENTATDERGDKPIRGPEDIENKDKHPGHINKQ
ncbi:hypothetical protein [Tropicimonas sp. IMCC34011]|nr:hypothetical protein [Tropicimonas sp. IMCC34011]